MSDSTHAALTSSINPNWKTPRWLFDALNIEFAFVLDLAANAGDHLCGDWLGPDSPLGVEDALIELPWADLSARQAGFMNPPYSREQGTPIDPWVEKAARESEHMIVVGLIPYSPQTKWWRKYIVGVDYRATEIRIFPYRLKFDPPDDYVGKASGANVNTAVVIWKPTEDFIDPWVPHLRYWNPGGIHTATKQVKAASGDPDDE